MNKLLSIAFCAAAVSAFADPAEAVLGQVGVTAITSSLQNTIVAVSYDDLAGGSGMVVSNLVKTANLEAGDQLAVFNNGEGSEIYDTWTLTKDENDVLYWAKNDKTFFVDANGLREGEGQAASAVTNMVGTGIWLCRKTPPTGSFTFYIYGKPSTAKTITTTPGVWNLVGNPTQGDVTITKAIAPGANNDEILVPGEQGLVRYLYKTAANDHQGGWLRAKNAQGEWGPAPDITAGTGFWIKTTSAITINWQPAGN